MVCSELIVFDQTQQDLVHAHDTTTRMNDFGSIDTFRCYCPNSIFFHQKFCNSLTQRGIFQ